MTDLSPHFKLVCLSIPIEIKDTYDLLGRITICSFLIIFLPFVKLARIKEPLYQKHFFLITDQYLIKQSQSINKLVKIHVILKLKDQSQSHLNSMAMDLMTNSYIVLTFALFAYTFNESFNKADNYFSACLIYLDSPFTNFILYNVAFSLAILIYKLVVIAFFAEVKENETMKILDKLKGKIFHVLIFLYISRAEISLGTFVCLSVIFLMFIIHHLGIFRAEYVPFLQQSQLIHTPTTTMSLNLNIRLFVFFLILGFLDFEIVTNNLDLLYSSNFMSVIFIYYLLNTSLKLLFPMINYFADFYEKYTLCHFNNSDEHLALIGLIVNVPRLIIQILLAIWVTFKIGFSFLLLLDIVEYVSELNETVRSYMRVKRLTDTMKNLKTIKETQIAQYHDNTCMVCFQEMTEATLLPCKHFFHDQCLRQWIVKNSNHFCPKCKKEFNFESKKNQNSEENDDQNGHNGNDDDDQNEAIQRRNLIRVRQEVENRRKTFEQHLKRAKQQRQKQALTEKADGTKHSQKIYPTKEQRNSGKMMKEEQKLLQDTKQPTILEERESLTDNMHAKKEEKIFQRLVNHEEPEKVHSKTKRDEGIVLMTTVKSLPFDIPEEIVRQNEVTHLRAGSLPFGMPTQAVYHRTFKHIYVRENYQRASIRLTEDFSVRRYEQMMLMAPH